MFDMLSRVLDENQDLFRSCGISVTVDNSRLPKCISADLDSQKYVGTITHWPKARFEFQFNSCKSGEPIILDTTEFNSDKELSKYIQNLVLTKLT